MALGPLNPKNFHPQGFPKTSGFVKSSRPIDKKGSFFYIPIITIGYIC
jgi:hypothetical protein